MSESMSRERARLGRLTMLDFLISLAFLFCLQGHPWGIFLSDSGAMYLQRLAPVKTGTTEDVCRLSQWFCGVKCFLAAARLFVNIWYGFQTNFIVSNSSMQGLRRALNRPDRMGVTWFSIVLIYSKPFHPSPPTPMGILHVLDEIMAMDLEQFEKDDSYWNLLTIGFDW